MARAIKSSIARNAAGSHTATVTIGKCIHVLTKVQKANAIAPMADGSSSYRLRQSRYIDVSAISSFIAASAVMA